MSTPTHDAITIPAVIEQTRDDLRRFDFTAIAYLATTAAISGAVIGALAEFGHDVPRTLLSALAPAAVPAVAAAVCATLVLWARTTVPSGPPTPGSWLHAARTPSWRALLTSYEEADLTEAAARRLWTLSRITEAKFRWLRRASAWTVVFAAHLLVAAAVVVITAF